MTAREAYIYGVRELKTAGLASSELDAELLLCEALGWSKEDFARQPEFPLSQSVRTEFVEMIRRRKHREPIAYIAGRKEFYKRSFSVNSNVLIPRPETEGLVDLALSILRDTPRPVIADIGTGSGCIAVTMALELSGAHVLATDISMEALEVAEENALRHRVSTRIEFMQGNLLLPLAQRRIDLIIANLPYVPDTEIAENPDLMHEPLLALRGKHGPDSTLEEFLSQWYAREQRPTAILEIHPNQRERLEQEHEKIGVTVTFKQDLAQRDRIAILQYRKA